MKSKEELAKEYATISHLGGVHFNESAFGGYLAGFDAGFQRAVEEAAKTCEEFEFEAEIKGRKRNFTVGKAIAPHIRKLVPETSQSEEKK